PIEDIEDEGRTVVRGGPKIVKRAKPSTRDVVQNQLPTTISPSAVIKQSLEAARAGNRPDHLMPPPPRELLEDLADRSPPSSSASLQRPVSPHTAAMPMPPAAPMSQRHFTGPPPPMTGPHLPPS